MSQPWFSAETVIVRTWCIYTPRTYEEQSLQDRPCILVMRCPEQAIVQLLGRKRAYSWEWDWDREHGFEVHSASSPEPDAPAAGERSKRHE